MNSQSGQALPLAILALAIGALVVAPFLGHAGSSLIGSRVYGGAIAAQSACDAGVEHAIWSLTRGSLAEEFAEPGDQVTYQLDETINGLTASVTVTANATGGSGTAGDIANTAIDTLEFDTSNGYEPSIVRVADNIYAIAYRGTSNDGFLKTVSIAADGAIGNSVIDSLEFDTANGYEPCIVHVSGNIYAIAYRGSGSDGFIKTVSIAANGDIGNSVIDSLEFDTSDGFEPCIVHVSGTIYAVAYRGSSNRGYLKTVTIAANGDIGNAVIDTLIFDTTLGYEPSIIYASGIYYAVAYRGPSNRGYLKTVTIAANGDIGNAVIDTLIFDTSASYEPSIINVSGITYAIAYRGPGNDGFVKTVAIAPGGDIGNSVIDTRGFADNYCYELRIIHAANDIYAVAFRGQSNRGRLKTISIAADGDIANSLIDTLDFDTSGYEPTIINVSGGIFAIAYRGPGSDGFVKTVAITGGGVAAYEIVATAGGRTIRAFVNAESTTATIVSWQIE